MKQKKQTKSRYTTNSDIRIPTYIKDGKSKKQRQKQQNRNTQSTGNIPHHLKSFSVTRIKSHVLALMSCLILGIIAAGNKIACAKGEVSEVTDGIDVLKDIVLACVGGVGVIFLAWGLLDFATAYAAHETTQQSQAIKKVIGGLIVIAVPSILKLLGAT